MYLSDQRPVYKPPHYAKRMAEIAGRAKEYGLSIMSLTIADGTAITCITVMRPCGCMYSTRQDNLFDLADWLSSEILAIRKGA